MKFRHGDQETSEEVVKIQDHSDDDIFEQALREKYGDDEETTR